MNALAHEYSFFGHKKDGNVAFGGAAARQKEEASPEKKDKGSAKKPESFLPDRKSVV